MDAYRDFLQPLGSKPLSLEAYLSGQPTKSYPLLTDVYKMFRGRSCLVVALNNSQFFHLGTVNELFDLYLNKNAALAQKFRHNLIFTSRKNSHLASSSSSSSISDNTCIINCRLGKNTSIKDGSILEYCLVDDQTRFEVGQNCFLSNCWIQANGNAELKIPDNIFLHTVSVKINGELKYITIFFDRRDDLKKIYSSLDEVKFLGKSFPKKLAQLVEQNGSQSNSIWNLKLFRAYESMNNSFRRSIEFIREYLIEQFDNAFEDFSTATFYSLFDLLKYRCYENMISFRTDNKLI